jgi:hypothetical protein
MLFLHRCRWISGHCGREYDRRFLMGDGTDRRRRPTLVGPVAKVGAARGCTSTVAASGEAGAGGAPNPGVLATLVPLRPAPGFVTVGIVVEAVGRPLIGAAA